MASVESNKKVARAAKAGGGRSRKQTSTSWGYYGTLIGIAVVGLSLIGVSWSQTQEDPNPPYLQTEARAKKELDRLQQVQQKFKDKPDAKELKAAQKRYDDYFTNRHIHAAYGIYDCTAPKGAEWLPPINGEQDPDPQGIHAHADGLLHVHPFSKVATGRRASMDKWFNATGVKVSSKQIFLPGKLPAQDGSLAGTEDRTLNPGKKCTNGKASVIRVFEYRNVIKDGKALSTAKGIRIGGDPGGIRMRSGYAYVFARVDKDFVPPLPPSVKALEAPSDQVTATPSQPLAESAPTPPTPGSTVAGSTVAGSTVAGSTVAGSTTPGTTKPTPASSVPASAPTT
jgi:hypothetical protein